MQIKAKSYANVELQLTALQVVWLQHSGFLEQIARMHNVNYHYNGDQIILTAADKNYCQNAIEEMDKLLFKDFCMEIHNFQNFDEMAPFFQLFHMERYKQMRSNTRGFWIYSSNSLEKQLWEMREQRRYIGRLPQLPTLYLIIWFPSSRINYIKQEISRLIGYQFNQGGSNLKSINPLTALEALSIFLILNIEQLSYQFSARFILKQDHDQFSLQIQSASNLQEAYKVIEDHVNKRKFWPFYNVVSTQLLELEHSINQVVRTNASVKLFSKEDVLQEANQLDNQFGIDLCGILKMNTRADMIYVYGDEQKQEEISEKLVSLVRKLNNVYANKQFTNYQTPTTHNSSTINNYTFMQNFLDESNDVKQGVVYCYPPLKHHQNPHQNYYQNDDIEYQNKLRMQQYKQLQQEEDRSPPQLKNYKQQQSKKQQSFVYVPKEPEQTLPNFEQSTIHFQYDNISQQSEILPLKNYRNSTQKKDKKKHSDSPPYTSKFSPPILYEYVYKNQQEESKLTQLIQIEEVSLSIDCQILKIELLHYQLIYQQNKSNPKKIQFEDHNDAFQEYIKQNFNNWKHDFYCKQNYIEIDLKVENENYFTTTKSIFHKYFTQILYYVTAQNETSQKFIETLENQFDIQVITVETDINGFITHDEFSTLNEVNYGNSIVIIVKNFMFKDKQLIVEKFGNFEISQAFFANSSIIDNSRYQNQKGVVVLSDEQIDYLNQHYPQLDCMKLMKFREIFKIQFNFVQIDCDEYASAKFELSKFTQKYVNEYIEVKKKETKGQLLRKLKQEDSYVAYKIYEFNNIQQFYTNLLDDKLSIMSFEEYQKNKPIFNEAMINLGQEKLKKELLDDLFNKQYPIIKKNSIIGLGRGNFITVLIRSERFEANTLSQLDHKSMLLRGYIEKL